MVRHPRVAPTAVRGVEMTRRRAADAEPGAAPDGRPKRRPQVGLVVRRLCMGAGFDFAAQVHWGTNGAIEAYLEALAQIAAERFGADDRLAAAFGEERDGFFTGKVVFLDDILTEAGDQGRFIGLLDAATDKLLQEQVFTDHGREWVATVIRALRGRLVQADPAAADA